MALLTLREFSEFDTESLVTNDLILVSRGGTPARLNYDWERTRSYLTDYCNTTNPCPNGNYPTDCTHFVCHALNKGNVFIKNPSAHCEQGMGINARELGTSFRNSVSVYSNVHAIESLESTREGDYAFIPSWFGLDYDHAMVLASPISEKNGKMGSKRWQHTRSRCGAEWAAFDADVVVFRID